MLYARFAKVNVRKGSKATIYGCDRVRETMGEQILSEYLGMVIEKKGWDIKSQEFKTQELSEKDSKIRDLIVWYVEWCWQAKYTGIPFGCELGGPMPAGYPYCYPNRDKKPLNVATATMKIKKIDPYFKEPKINWQLGDIIYIIIFIALLPYLIIVEVLRQLSDDYPQKRELD